MRAVSQRTRSLLALRNRTARMLVVICNVHLVSVAKVRAHPQQPSRLRLTLCRTRRSRSRCRTRRKFRSASDHACAYTPRRQPTHAADKHARRPSPFLTYYICAYLLLPSATPDGGALSRTGPKRASASPHPGGTDARLNRPPPPHLRVRTPTIDADIHAVIIYLPQKAPNKPHKSNTQNTHSAAPVPPRCLIPMTSAAAKQSSLCPGS